MNVDYKYLYELKGLIKGLNLFLCVEEHQPPTHPLDADVLKHLNDIHLSEDDSEYTLYQYQDAVHDLWVELLTKSIQCLRFFDKREPFLENPSKHPLAYGIVDIDTYYNKYREFEKVMYGGVSHYRDHIVHVFRVWLLGCVILCRNNCSHLRKMYVDMACQINNFEKLSIWTIISLTHDLGYPLEKASQIIDKTKDMMTAFITNPMVSMDLSFNGVQNSMNDFILRLMSSKMTPVVKSAKGTTTEYVTRLQPKYYFKFQKSLEHNNHGILSAIIIYKLLLYFLESDFTINEDYRFQIEDVRQFYIRRDILRAIASHTCSDVYQMNQFLFSFLLIVCDEAQTWGRKGITELYVNRKAKYEFKDIVILENNTLKVEDYYEVENDKDAENILYAFKRQCINYVSIFRDGQDTNNRNFDFIWIMSLKVKRSKFIVVFEAKRNENIRMMLKSEAGESLSNSNNTVKNFDKLFDKNPNLKIISNMHEWSFVKAII